MQNSPKPKKKKKIDYSSIAILFLPVAFLLGIGGGYILWGQDSGGSGAAEETFNPVDDDPFVGPEDAPVTIVQFSDYECYYCIKWHNEVYVQLMAEYPGQIRFVYRDFPLASIHPGAEPAAQAANCAGDQDSYWDYHDALFTGSYDLDRAGFLQIAGDLGLDADAFAQCIDSGKYAAEVAADLNDGLSIGVESTPTFYINGFQVLGAQPYATFKGIVDDILAGQ